MCQFKSAIILKDRIFVPDYNHHTQMLEELRIKDTQKNAETLFVRAELTPKGNDVFSPISECDFNVDQDFKPAWFVEEHEKQCMVDAVERWDKKYIHIGKNDFYIGQGIHYLKDCKKVICGNSTVNAYDNSTIKACGNSTVNITMRFDFPHFFRNRIKSKEINKNSKNASKNLIISLQTKP